MAKKRRKTKARKSKRKTSKIKISEEVKQKPTKRTAQISAKNIAKLSRDAERLNSILVENFVNLQKALTNLTVKFESLSDQISKLLQLFEISAKSFAEKLATGAPDIEKDREFLDKLNKLLEQNKVIAKGLTLMEERVRERIYGPAGKTAPRAPVYQAPMPSPQAPAGYSRGLTGRERRPEEAL